MKKCWWYCYIQFSMVWILCVIVIIICSGDRWYVCEFNFLDTFSSQITTAAIGEFRITEKELSTLPAGGTMTAIRGKWETLPATICYPSEPTKMLLIWDKTFTAEVSDLVDFLLRNWKHPFDMTYEMMSLPWKKTACPLCPTHRQNSY